MAEPRDDSALVRKSVLGELTENERLRTWLERIAQTDTPFMAHEWARQALEEAALFDSTGGPS